MPKPSYELRKAQGLCIQCGVYPARAGRILCETCNNSKSYYRRKVQGLCIRCGTQPARAEKTTCAACAEEIAADNQWYKDHGICTQCRRENAIEGRVLCFECGEKKAEAEMKRRTRMSAEEKCKKAEYDKAYRKARHAAGLCVQCGRPLAGTQYQRCVACRTYGKNIQMERSTANYYALCGKCRLCGKEPEDGFSFCTEHLEKARQRAERNFRPFGKPIADRTYWKQLNSALFRKRTGG